jgi:hypothetical protein
MTIMQKIMTFRWKCCFLYPSHSLTPCSQSFCTSSINGSKKSFMSMSTCLGPDMRVVNRRYFCLWPNHREDMLRRPEPRKPPCSCGLSIESFSPSNQRTSVGYSCSSSGESVINHFDIWHVRNGAFAFYVRVFTTMMDIQSIVGSPLPTLHETEQEATFHSRAGRSHRTNTHGASTAAGATIAAAHRQHSVATVAMPPPGASLEATLESACQVLHNPLGPLASPSAAEQWHHDVDQLTVAAINTPPHGGGGAGEPP